MGPTALATQLYEIPRPGGTSGAEYHPNGVLRRLLWSPPAAVLLHEGPAAAPSGGRGASAVRYCEPALLGPVPAVGSDVVGSRALHLALLGELPAQGRELPGNPGLFRGDRTLLGGLLVHGAQGVRQQQLLLREEPLGLEHYRYDVGGLGPVLGHQGPGPLAGGIGEAGFG